MKPNALLTFLLIFVPYLHAQHASFGIEVKPKLGFLMAHRGVMGHLPREHAVGGELAWYFRPSGAKSWHTAYRKPLLGAALYASSVGNREVLGSFYGTYGFIEFPFVSGRRSEFTGKLGAGLGYGTRVFDQQSNPKNVAMSTHVNALISLGLQYRYFWKDYHLLLGLDLTHFSNGSTKVPNLGINLPYASIGIGKVLHRAPSDSLAHWEKRRIAILPIRKWEFSAQGIVSVKEVYPTGRRKFPIYALSLRTERRFSATSGIEIALDWMYKSSIEVYKLDFFPTKKRIDYLQAGVYVGYVLPLDRLRFVLGMGAYVRDVYNPDDHFYHRIGMRYRATKHLDINLILKSHWAKADYVEYGIGYVF